MNEFDPIAYFAEQEAGNAQAANDPAMWLPESGNKQVEVSQATDRKVQALRDVVTRREATWAGQLGLQPTDALGRAVNVGASVASSTVNAVGDLGGGVHSLVAMGNEAAVPAEAQAAYARYKNNQATEADVALLEQSDGGNQRYFDHMEQATKSRATADQISEATDWSGIVDQTARQGLSEDLREGGADGLARLDQAGKAYGNGELFSAAKNLAIGLADLTVEGGGALLSNPQATLEYVSEIVPDLILGAASKSALVLRNVGMGLEAYNDGVTKYAAENNGELPPKDVQLHMAANAFGMALLDTVGEVSLLKAVGKAKTPAEGVTSVKGKAGNTVKAGAKNAAIEGGTEGLQTVMEGEARLEPATAAEIYEATVIGAGVGTSIAAPAAALQETGKHVQEVQAEVQKQQAEDRGVDAQITSAIVEGRYEDLTNPEKRKQFPQDRVAAALVKDATREDATPEIKKQSLAALARMESELTEYAEGYKVEYRGVTQEGRKELKQDIAKFKAKVTELEANDQAEAAAPMKDMLATLEQNLSDMQKMPKAEREEHQDHLEMLDRALTLAQEGRQSLTRENQAAVPDLVAQVDATDATPEARTQAAAQAVTLAMEDPDVLDADTALRWSEDTSLALDSGQRTFLRTLSDAVVARNAASDLETVSRDIFSAKARDGFRSLPQYQSTVASAIQAKNFEVADRQVAQLQAFVQSHQAKAALAEQAMKAVGPGRQMAIWADESAEGGWRLAPHSPKQDAALRKNGGMSFSSGSQKLADAVVTEARAIDATHKQLSAQITLAKQTDVPEAANDPVEQPEVASSPESSEQTTEETSVEAPVTTEDEPVVAADTTPTVDEVETQTEPEVDEEVESNEVLGIFRESHEKLTGNLGQAAYRETNLVQAFFKQTKTKEGKTKRPLSAVEDFFSSVLARSIGGLGSLSAYLPAGKTAEVDQARVEQLELFHNTAGKWNQVLAKAFKEKEENRKTYRYEDFVQFLATGGELDENVRTALSVAAFTWLTEEASQSPYNTPDTIRAILGKEDHEAITSAEWATFGTAGARQTLVINDMGRRAVQALGLKPHNSDVPANVQAQLEASMGSYVLDLLAREGLVERHPIDIHWFAREGEESTAPYHWFVRVKRDTDATGDLVNLPAIEAMVETNKGTKGGLNVLFGVESSVTGPSFTAPEHSQTTTKGTRQAIPSEQKAILTNYSKREWQLRGDMVGLRYFRQDLVERMFGVTDPGEHKVQAAREKALQGKNDSLKREISHYMAFIDSPDFRDETGAVDLTRPFFFNWIAWRQQRAGIVSNTINPLSSKIHRFLVKMPEWEHTVSLAGDAPELTNFKLAVLEGLGVGTDKQTNVTSLSGFDGLVAHPVYQAALDPAYKFATGQEMTDSDQEALAAAVIKGGEGAHSLDALVHLSYFTTAQRDGKDSFQSTLVREGDGINNGPILALLQSGAWNSPQGANALANKGGIFEQDNEHEFFGSWKEDKGNDDLYETLARQVDGRVRDAWVAADQGTRERYVGAFNIIGAFTEKDQDDGTVVTKKGRKRVKTPMTAMIFGSGLAKSITNMGQELVDTFYVNVEDIANDTYESEAARADALRVQINAINALLPGESLNPDMSIDQAMALEFSRKQREGIAAAFSDSVGEHVKASLEDQYKPFLDFRKQMNNAARLSFDMHKIVRDFEYRKLVDELMESEALAYTVVKKVKRPIEDLSGNQLKELDKRIAAVSPLVHTVMSKDSGDSLASGLRMAKVVRENAPAEQVAYNVQVAFTDGHPVASAPEFYKESTMGSLRGRAMLSQETDPGVAMFIMLIHAMDSSIISRVYGEMPGLNVHDAIVTAANQLQPAIQEMNYQTFNNMVGYSLPEQMMKAAFKVLDGFEGHRDALQADPVARKALEKLEAKQSIGQQLAGMLQAADTAERHKLQWLTSVHSVNQYGVEGAQYLLTEEDHQRVAERQKTSVTDRVLRDRAQARMETPSVVAANLSEWVAQARETLRKQSQKRALTDTERADLETARRISDAYVDTGSLEAALSRVFRNVPGDAGKANQASRKKWRRRLQQVVVDSSATVRNIRTAPLAHIKDMLEQGSQSETVPADLRKAMGNVALTFGAMLEAATTGDDVASIEYAVHRTLPDNPDLAAGVLDYLGRKYNQRQTVWGTLGQPRMPSDSVLVSAFTQKPRMNRDEAFEAMKTALKAQTRTAQWRFQVDLLGALKSKIDPAMEFQFITADTPSAFAPEANITKAKGWHTHKADGSRVIQVKGPDFIESNLTVELLLHEILHNVTTDALKDSGSPFVRNLEQILVAAQEKVNSDPSLARYTNAVSSLDELVAWGMSNQGFQQDVLAKVEVTDTRSRTTKVIDGLKAFVSNLAKLVLPNLTKQEQATNGLYQLIENAAGIFAQTTRAKQRQQEEVFKQEEPDTFEKVQQYTTTDVFDALKNDRDTDPAFSAHLRELLNTVVHELHGPFGVLKAQEQANAMYTAQEVYARAEQEGQLPFVSEALGHFSLTDQQAYVLEQVEVSVRASLSADSLAYKDLVRVFRDARTRLTPADFDSQAQYDFVFKLQDTATADRSDHLSRFAAMALTYPPLYTKLNQAVSAAPQVASDKIGDRLQGWFDIASQRLSDRVNKTRPLQGTNERVGSLVRQLVSIESKRKASLVRKKEGTMEQAEAAARVAGQKVRHKVGEAAQKLGKRSKSAPVRAISKVTAAVAQDRVGELMDALEAFRVRQYKTRQGFVASLLTEARGPTENTQAFHDLVRMAGIIERQRKHLMDNAAEDVLGAYANGTDFSQDQESALTRVLLRTDMQTLLAEYDMEDLTRMVSDGKLLEARIKEWEAKLQATGKRQDYYLAYGRMLGHFMATGEVRGPHMNMNAYTLARQFGVEGATVSEAAAKQAESILDPLVSLYALQATADKDRKLAGDILKHEDTRGLESGALFTLKFQASLNEKAKAELFDGDPVHFMKGYTREIYNQHRDVVAATAKEGQELIRKGWVYVGPLQRDQADPDAQPKGLYTVSDNGLQTHLTGAVGYTGGRVKGSRVHGGEYLMSQDAVHAENEKANQRIRTHNRRRVELTAQAGARFNPATQRGSFMAPVYNRDGKIVNYRYLMTEKNKDVLLERDNRLGKVMGSLAGNIYDKAETAKQNRTVITALKEQYDLDFKRNPKAYIKLGPESDDAQARETYHLLPPDTKKAIKEIWGRSEVMVRADTMDLVFGYRKFSASSMFDKPALERTIVERVLVDLVSHIPGLSAQTALRIRRGENAWQEIVKEVKDAWVIKNLSTFLGNVASNVSILLAHGVTPRKLAEDHAVAIRGLLDYQKDSDELMRLERRQETQTSLDPQATDQRIRELRDALARNPVKVLIDEGLFQSILEDVDTEEDPYSYKTRLVRVMENKTAGAPKALKSAGRVLYMAHDTPFYKLMFKATQMSDFVARYTLYNKLVARESNPLSHEDAVHKVTETFVNYDIPTSRALQYLNDTGLVFFTKYYLRIQRVLFNLFQEQPARTLMLALFSNYISDIPTVLDSGIDGVDSPLDTGAMNYPDAVGEIMPIKMGLSLF